MRVYVLVCNYHSVDSGDFTNDVVGVYEKFEDAQKEMKKIMVEVRDDFKRCDAEEDNYVDGDMSWSIWEKGEWVNFHCDITIHEKEIQ